MNGQLYLDSIKMTLATSSIVKCIDIVQERVFDMSGFIRIRVRLINDDFMELMEFFRIQNDQAETVEYRYQWMDSEKSMLRKRWDNAAHYPALPNFPHHVHVGDDGQVQAGQAMGIVSLIDLIEQNKEINLLPYKSW